jgi:hypothetical protein
VTDNDPALCATDRLEADNITLPGVAAAAEPVIDTEALVGIKIAAPPLAADKATVKDLLPENGVALLMLTEKVFDAASPLAQDKVPMAAV